VRQEGLEARAKELSAQVRVARPTDPGEIAAQLRWLARELSEEGGIGEQYAAALKPIAAQLEAMAGRAAV
jgi:hypothetical protein